MSVSARQHLHRSSRYNVSRYVLVVLTLSAVLGNWLGVDALSIGPLAAENASTAASSCCCAKRGGECHCGSGCCGNKAKLAAAQSPAARSQTAVRHWLSCPQQRPDGMPTLQAPDWLTTACAVSFSNDTWFAAPASATRQHSHWAAAPPTPPPRSCAILG